MCQSADSLTGLLSALQSGTKQRAEAGDTGGGAHSLACCSAFWRSSSLLMLPSASVLTLTIFMPAMTADAGLVPCADVGMMHTLRCVSPRDWWYARMAMSPAYSPLAPELGCSETLSKPVISVSCPARSCTRRQGIISRRQRLVMNLLSCVHVCAMSRPSWLNNCQSMQRSRAEVVFHNLPYRSAVSQAMCVQWLRPKPALNEYLAGVSMKQRASNICW